MGYSVDSLVNELKRDDISSRSFFITGGNSGFGFIVAKILLLAGAKVTIGLGCRSEERARSACTELEALTENKQINYLLIDLSKPSSIKACVEQIRLQDIHFNVLVNNAGISLVQTYTEAPTGLELTCQTNYFVPLLRDDPRVILVSSVTYPQGAPSVFDREHLCVDREHYGPFKSYFRSKYLLTSYSQYLTRHNPQLYVVVCDPGVAATSIARELGCIGKIYHWSIFQVLIPSWKGACTIAFAAASSRVKSLCRSGDMCYKCAKKELVDRIKSEGEQNLIFDITQDILKSLEFLLC